MGYGKVLLHQDKLYIPNEYDNRDKADNRMLILDLTSNEITSIAFPYLYPNDVVEYNDSIIISHSSTVSPNGSMVSVYDIKTGKISSHDSEETIKKWI